MICINSVILNYGVKYRVYSMNSDDQTVKIESDDETQKKRSNSL